MACIWSQSNANEQKLPSLCDEWNVLAHLMALGPEYESFETWHYSLTSDTIFNGTRYTKLEQDGTYKGAMREDENGRIYIYPFNGWQQEFLIYDFNAQVGDTLKDLYIGNRYFEYGPRILYATVEDIKPTTPRTFVLDVVYIYPGIEDAELLHWEIKWIEGVGMTDGPVGNVCPLNCEGGAGMELLCAYMEGEQVYTSAYGKEYGCYYDGEKPQATTWHCVSVYRDMFDYDNVYFSPATYQLQGDTLFGDTRYKTLRSENGTYCGAVRKTDDGQQVYYHPRGAERYPATIGKEYLLYDFSVKAGDTTVVYNGFMDIYNEEGHPYVHFTDSMVVVSVQVIDGRKHVLVQRLHETGQVEWIEGIGTRSVLFSCDRNVLPGNNWGLYTLCAADSEGNVLYSFDTDYLGIHNNQCQLEPLAIENVHTDSSSASKLLRDGQLIIRHGKTIYNAQGVLIK